MIRRSLLATVIALTGSVDAATKPNIVIVLTDDMGYSDIGCFGGEIHTPTLDGLAANGLRFTQFYNTARCCPTRASLLTGLYPHQAGIGHMTDDRGHDGYRGDLNRNCVTIAEVLRHAGYRTYMTGKWHVTKALSAKTDADKHNWPLQRGFDRFYGTIIGGGSLWDPSFLTRDNTQVSAFADPEYRPSEPYYYTDAISDHAVRYVNDHHAQHGDKPFFLYVAYTAAHWPMHAHESDIAKYRGKYAAGYQAIRDQRYQRMLDRGVITKPATTLLPVPAGIDQTPHWEWDQRNMEVFAAMVDRMDQGLGKLVETLKSTGQLDNTLFFYLQDNGGCAEGMGRGKDGPERAAKPSLSPMMPEELQTTLIPKQTRDGYPIRQGKGVMAGGADTYIGYGEAWAAVSNTPFREYKHWVHEGGISTPLVVHWPAGITPEQRGKLRHDPGHLVDLMATCVDVAGATYPHEVAGQSIKPMRGASLRPAFSTKPVDRKEPLFWEHEGNRAVRDGRWKLVAMADKEWELYDIDNDRSEQHDLARAQSDRVRDLAARWDRYAKTSDVLPLGGWKSPVVGPRLKSHYTLRDRVTLAKEQAPQIHGRGIMITADITTTKPARGVIIAQGGTAHGYTLFVQDGNVVFLIRRDNEATSIRTGLPEGTHQIRAELTTGGQLRMQVDDEKSVLSDPVGLLEMPVDGLQVGHDAGGLVGPYEKKNDFNGTIHKIEMELIQAK